MVVFSYTVSDFGIPKVIGGNYHVLAIDIYQQVIGQQNFNRGAVVGLILLMPVVIAFAIDWMDAEPPAVAILVARGGLRAEDPRGASTSRCSFFARSCAYCMLAVLGMAIYTSFIKLWPYDKSFSLRHYGFGLIDGGVIDSYFNSLRMALLTAFAGTVLIFGGAYLLEKTRGLAPVRTAMRFLAVDSDGGSGHGAGPRLHLFLQRAIATR